MKSTKVGDATRKEILPKVRAAGALGYRLEDVLLTTDLADFEREGILEELQHPESDVAKAYRAGNIQAEMQIETRIFDLAKSGDLKAIAEFEKRKLKRKRRQEIEGNNRVEST